MQYGLTAQYTLAWSSKIDVAGLEFEPGSSSSHAQRICETTYVIVLKWASTRQQSNPIPHQAEAYRHAMEHTLHAVVEVELSGGLER